MFLNILINIVFFLIIVIVVRNSFEVVPPIHFAVPVWFGKRINAMVLYEGLKLKPPFSKLWTESLVPRTLKSDFSFFARNNREVVVKTTTRWKPDPTIKSEESGGPRCIEITDEFIDQGLKSKIESEIGRFGGLHDHSEFIDNRRAIEYFIDSILRLEVPPHVDPAKFLGEKGTRPEIERDRRLNFYNEHSGIIGKILREKASEQKSYTEEFYGVDILNFTVDDVTFSDKTRDALEARERAKDELRGMALLQDGRVAVIAELVDRGIDPEAALDAADALLKISEKKTISIPGLKNIRLFGGE